MAECLFPCLSYKRLVAVSWISHGHREQAARRAAVSYAFPELVIRHLKHVTMPYPALRLIELTSVSRRTRVCLSISIFSCRVLACDRQGSRRLFHSSDTESEPRARDRVRQLYGRRAIINALEQLNARRFGI